MTRVDRRHAIPALAAAAVMFATLSSTGGYALYLRSGWYRGQCSQALSEYLGLPSEIGGVVPRSRTATQFDNVTVYLPGRRGIALRCSESVVSGRPTSANPDAYIVDLLGGECEISSRTWLREDFRQVFESGLRPSFDLDGPDMITFSRMNVVFSRDDFRLSLLGASGAIRFVDRRVGHANLQCRNLNGRQTDTQVTLRAEFSPTENGIRIDQVELRVHRLPFALLGLDRLMGAKITEGEFAGRLTYAESDAGRDLIVEGSCYDVNLAEWTAPFLPTPWRGRCPEIKLSECRIRDRMLLRLRFGGNLADVELADILAAWGLDGVAGRLSLRVEDADLTPDGVRRFVASGQCVDVSLAALTRALGWGEMTGVLRVVIENLHIENNKLVALDADVRIAEATGQPHRVAGSLIRQIVNRALKMNLPPFLPETIEYTRFGMRIEVRDELLRLYGTHGPREKIILTARLWGGDVPLIPEPPSAIDLSPSLDELRRTALPALKARLESLRSTTTGAAYDPG